MGQTSVLDLAALQRDDALVRRLSATGCSEWPHWPPRKFDHSPIGEKSTDIAGLLWTDKDLACVPAEKAAHVLVAIQQAINQRCPLQAAESDFLAQVASVTAGDPGAFSEVWQTPQAFFWTRRACELFGAAEHGDGRKELAQHFDQFKLFRLGISWLTNTEVLFNRPLSAKLPLAIPGTHWSLDGDESIEIIGLTQRRLCVKRRGKELAISLRRGHAFAAGSLTACECPVARQAGYELPLQAHAFHQPGLAIAEPVLRAGMEYQRQHISLVEQTLSNIHRYAPEIFDHFRRTIRLAALKPPAWGKYDDFSEPLLPGTFVASAVPNPLEMADHLIHELQHNRLSLIEESGPLFDQSTDDAATDARFLFSLRDKPRALYGIFHGVYVFVAVSRYWLQVYRTGNVGLTNRAYVIDRLLRLPKQLALAVGVLKQHARLTPLGQAVFAELERETARVRQQIARAGLPTDSAALLVAENGAYVPEASKLDGKPLSVREAVLEHIRRNDIHQQCDGLLDEPPVAAAA